jgi:acyl carrier protein
MTDLATEILDTLHAIAPDVDPDTVDRARPLADQLDLDSMDYQNLLAALSTRYAIAIPEPDVPTLRSVEDLARYVQAHTRRPGSSLA